MSNHTFGIFAYVLGLLSAFCTAFYSMRSLYLTFLGKTNGYKKVVEHAHEPKLFMLVPLFVLGIGSIFVGYLGKDLFMGLLHLSGVRRYQF